MSGAARLLLAAALASCAAAPGAPGRPSAAPSDASLFAAREAVWRDYFAGAPGLAEALPDDFVAIVEGDSLWAGRAETLASARASAAGGTRLVELRFPRNAVQRHGDVAVIHSRYEAVLRRGDDTWTLRGLITEVFVWDGRRWMHPSWHMGVEPPPGS